MADSKQTAGDVASLGVTAALRGGKHSGSGQDRNYNLEDANNVFRQITGRDLKPDEVNWLNTRGDVGKTGHDVAARDLANGLNQLSQNIVSEANALGISGFDKTQADQVRDSIYQAGNRYINDNFSDLSRAQLQQIKVNQLQNPAVTDDHRAAVSRIVQSNLGRAATQDEIDFYGKEIAKGESPFELQQFIQTTPEYQKIQSDAENTRVKTESDAAREALNQQLLTSQDEAFKRALPQIMSSYMRAGRINSSGIDSAVARAKQDLESQRQNYLAQLGYEDAVRQQGYNREDFVTRNRSAFDSYLRQSAPIYQRNADLTAFSYQQPFALADDRTARARQIEDYYRQQNDYDRYFSQARDQQREANIYGLVGNILGSGASAAASYYGRKG